jgi:asparagine synthetase B (glutamine-hydrolysing)
LPFKCDLQRYNEDYLPTRKADLTELRETVVEAVKDRLMADVPYAVLLSVGLCRLNLVDP